MTHEELLSKIKNLPEVIGLAEFKVRHDALLTIVELHKPQEITLPNGDWGTNCGHCDIAFTYPCPTIQAIERELV